MFLRGFGSLRARQRDHDPGRPGSIGGAKSLVAFVFHAPHTPQSVNARLTFPAARHALRFAPVWRQDIMEHGNMTAHSQLAPICYHPCDGSIYLLPGSRRVRRGLHIALLVALAWLAIGSAPLSAQRSEREARGIVGSLAGTIYNLAWPTAEYQDFSLGALQRVDDGWDVPIVLYGKSAFSGGILWLELVVELRNGSLHDIRLGRNNAVIAPPFATLATTALIVAAVIEQQQAQRPAQLAPGSPPQPSVTSPPIGSQRYLTAAELSGLSDWQLDVLRNEIYAWHGRRFQRADLQAYFNRQSWYRPVYAPEAFPERLLTSIERYNVELIASYQGNR